jgi:hypothetical protein
VHTQLQPQPQQHLQSGEGLTGMSLHWRVPMGRCVDAAPLVLALIGPASTCTAPTGGGGVPGATTQPKTAAVMAAGSVGAQPGAAAAAGSVGAQPEAAAGSVGAHSTVPEEVVGVLAFACSHSGVVKCIDIPTGAVCWGDCC